MSEQHLGTHLYPIYAAVADFARILMATGGEHLAPGLHLLLEATGADAVSIEREVVDDQGVSVVSEARVDKRTKVDGPLVEARVPICVGNRVAGEVIFFGVERAWDSNEIAVLRTVGDLVGSVWERREREDAERIRSDALAKARDLEVMTSRALVSCARTLLVGEDDASAQRALEALRTALRAAVAYVDPVAVDVPRDGNVLGSFIAASPEARESGVPLWVQVVPWTDFPGPNQRLAAGETVIIGDPHSIEARATGRTRSGCPMVKAEMAVPVRVNDQWAATLGVADTVERYWTLDQRASAEAIADIFGAYFERRYRLTSLRERLAEQESTIESLRAETT